MEKKKSLAKLFGVVFVLFTLLTIVVGGVMTYLNQTKIYHRNCAERLEELTSYLSGLIQQEGDEFVHLKHYFSEHTDEVQIPLDFRSDLPRAEKAYKSYMHANYPGKSYGIDLSFDELDSEAQKLYVNYRFEHWFTVFFDAVDKFHLSYVYFIYPEDAGAYIMNYMMDPTLTPKTTEDGKEIMFLGDKVYENPEEHKYMWQAWELALPPRGFDSLDNEFGYVYTYCYPLLINGEKLGLVCAEISVQLVISEILGMVLRQSLVSLAVLAFSTFLLYILLKRRIINRIIWLEQEVGKYSTDKDPSIAKEVMEKRGTNDELGSLTSRFSGMITELDSYMTTLQKVTAEKERIGAELSVATNIQADILPRIFPTFENQPEFKINATMTPAKEVGGDFFDFFFVDDTHLALVVADVSGKGVPAALFMVITKTLIKNRLLSGDSPAEALANVNEQLCEGNDSGYFVTVWAAVLDLSTGDGLEANAGHEHPAICKKGGAYELHRTKHSPAVAVMEGMRFRENPFHLDPGDRIFIYTDGVTEATNSANELFGEDRLVDALNLHAGDDARALLKDVRAEIDAFVAEAPQFDDITMLAFTYIGMEENQPS